METSLETNHHHHCTANISGQDVYYFGVHLFAHGKLSIPLGIVYFFRFQNQHEHDNNLIALSPQPLIYSSSQG